MKLDYNLINDVELSGIGKGTHHDYWCDAYITSATYDGREMTDAELDYINEDADFVYAQIEKWRY